MQTKVKQMTNNNRPVANHFLITTNLGTYLQSYNSIIVFVPHDARMPIQLGADWNYSVTTSKYRAKFLQESTKETDCKLKQGIYVLNENL